MPRARVIDISKDLPRRAHAVTADTTVRIFGGCVPQGGACTSPSDCCQVWVPNGGYVLCFFYRGHGIVRGYCTNSYAEYGGH